MELASSQKNDYWLVFIEGLGISQQEKISECGYTCCACYASILVPVSTHWLCLLFRFFDIPMIFKHIKQFIFSSPKAFSK